MPWTSNEKPKVGQLPDPSLQHPGAARSSLQPSAQGRAIARPFIATRVRAVNGQGNGAPKVGQLPDPSLQHLLTDDT